VKPRFRPALVLAALLAACSGARVQPPPVPTPSLPLAEAGKASFFFPVEIPLAEVRRIVEESLPPRVSDEQKQEISSALQDDYYRYALERGPVEVGFTGELLTFSFPVRGSLTVGGKLAGLPVHETVDIAGRMRGTASPAITPDWRPDPRPTARIELDRAVQGLFPPGLHGEVRIDSVRILGLGISGGAVWARCRMTGTISPLAR
jgi:hypothetical protein